MPLTKSEREKLKQKETKIKTRQITRPVVNQKNDLSIWTCHYCAKVHRGFRLLICRNENCISNQEISSESCIACYGSGRSSNELRCPICKGTGRKNEPVRFNKEKTTKDKVTPRSTKKVKARNPTRS